VIYDEQQGKTFFFGDTREGDGIVQVLTEKVSVVRKTFNAVLYEGRLKLSRSIEFGEMFYRRIE
jgi:hypothetical protein